MDPRVPAACFLQVDPFLDDLLWVGPNQIVTVGPIQVITLNKEATRRKAGSYKGTGGTKGDTGTPGGTGGTGGTKGDIGTPGGTGGTGGTKGDTGTPGGTGGTGGTKGDIGTPGGTGGTKGDIGTGSTRGIGPSGLGGIGPRKKVRQRPKVDLEAALLMPVCRICGATVPREEERDFPRARYCASCLAGRRKEVGAAIQAASQAYGDLYEDQVGVRPTHTVGARARRQSANALQRTMQREWEAVHKGEQFDPEWFREQILPGLAPLSLVTIAKETGMSTSAASRVRSGQRVPHPRHWEALAAISVGR